MSDRDPLQQLADFGTGGPVNPLPAAEVRRLGDRRRARRTAVSAVAGMTAVLAVAVPSAMYAARDGGKAPELPPTTTSPRVTSIPDDFPLDRASDYFEPNETIGPNRTADVPYPLPCGTPGIESERAADRLGFALHGEEFTDRRELATFADEETAAAAMEAIQASVEACPEETISDGFTRTYTPISADTGYASYSFSATVQPMGGSIYQYTRVGSAILTVVWGGEGTTHKGAVRDIGELTRISTAIAPAMCLWAEEGCAGESASPAPTGTAKEIADDFPLADGFPDYSEDGEEGYTGPSRILDPIAYDLCGDPLPDPAYRDRLIAGYTSAEDHRTRQLTTYADADAAVAASRAVIEAFRACATEGPDADGYVSEREVQPLTLGGESWAVLDRATMNGGETPYGSTLLVVRLGRAVIIEDHGSHAGYPTANGIRELSRGLAAPIAAMCVFTVAGCSDDTPSRGTVTDKETPKDDGEPGAAAGGFGPSLGGLRLGESLAEIASAGWTLAGEGDCIGLLPPGGGHIEQGMYQEGIGVTSIADTMNEGTPEGIKAGASKAAVQEAYPGATFTGGGGAERAVVRLDGPGQWEIGLADDEVVTVALVHDAASCTA